MAEPTNPSQQPQHPSYQYDAPPPVSPVVPARPAAGLPAFFAKWKTFLIVLLITAFVMMSRKGTDNVTANVQRKAMEQGQGPRISGSDLAAKQVELDAQQARLQKRQEELQRVLACQQTGKCDSTAPAGNGGLPPANLPPVVTGSGQPSELEQSRQQMAAERERAQYLANWSNPIVYAGKRKDVWAPRDMGIEQKPREATPERSEPAHSVATDTATSGDPNSAKFAYDRSTGPYHTILRGTPIATKLMNEITGDSAGPIVVQVDRGQQVYVKGTDKILFPEGTTVLGNITPVNSGTQRFLGVSFDRVIMPDGYSLSLNSTPGLSQSGHTGLTGQLDTHWASKLGWSVAVGAIEGLSSGVFLGGVGNSGGTTILRSPGQDMSELFQGILNRPPTVKVPIGTRVNIIMLEDLSNVPEWEHHEIRPGTV